MNINIIFGLVCTLGSGAWFLYAMQPAKAPLLMRHLGFLTAGLFVLEAGISFLEAGIR